MSEAKNWVKRRYGKIAVGGQECCSEAGESLLCPGIATSLLLTGRKPMGLGPK